MFTVSLLGLTFASGYVESGVLASIGALNVFLGEATGTTSARTRAAVVVAFGCGGGIALGTVVSTLGSWTIPAVAAVYFGLFLATRRPDFVTPVLLTGVLFAIGVGLPGPWISGAGVAGLLVLAGGLWATVGIAVTGAIVDLRRSRGSESFGPVPADRPAPTPWSTVLPRTAALAVAAAAGLAIADGLHLPRDYWLLLTLLVVLHGELRETYRYAVLRLGGTVVGAAAATGLVLLSTNVVVLAVALTAACAGTFALRRANYAVYTTALTIYVIVLLNEAYPAGPYLGLVRILDTTIGGGLALAAGVALAWAQRRRSQRLD